MMVQSHDNDWFYILRCNFQLWTKRFHYHFHITEATRRHFAHHELMQDEIDCRLVYRIAIAQRLQPSPHLVNGMNIAIKNFLLQWPCHLTDILNWRRN